MPTCFSTFFTGKTWGTDQVKSQSRYNSPISDMALKSLLHGKLRTVLEKILGWLWATFEGGYLLKNTRIHWRYGTSTFFSYFIAVMRTDTVMPEPGRPGGPPMFFTFRHDCDKMMNNQSKILVYGFKKHTPLITDYILLPVHTVVLVLIIWISFKVQTAVFKILERLGTRHINTIIKTNMVTKKFWM